MNDIKRLYMIGGPMGVGKTTVARCLRDRLPNCAFLDGDWCWDMRPFQVTEETKAMVTDNICHMLNNFLRCGALDNVVFCWVMHEQSIWDEILSRLDAPYALRAVTLVCREDCLTERIMKDVVAGLRAEDALERSLDRLRRCRTLDTMKLDVSEMSAEEAAARIVAL